MRESKFFYMLKGDMSLKIVERGVHKTIDIREGEAFMLPAKIPHSPQRKANTMGKLQSRTKVNKQNWKVIEFALSQDWLLNGKG